MCYYCANGLPEEVRAIFDELEKIDPDYEYGPGHISFSDYNLYDDNIEFCLDMVEKYRRGEESSAHDITPEQLDATEAALRKLLALPESIRVTPEYETWRETIL